MNVAQPWDPLFATRSPIFAPLRAAALTLQTFNDWPTAADLSRVSATPVQAASGAPIRFVDPRTASDSYEVSIYRRGEVPTRAANWHDLFNALVWLTFPQTKARLNALHYAAAQHRSGNNRTRAQDVLTLFDEGGLMVASRSDDLLDLIRRFAWKELFWNQRPRLSHELRFFLFGHALYDKARAPYKGMTAKAVLLRVEPTLVEADFAHQCRAVDALTARWFDDPRVLETTQSLAPVPLLGFPGWDPHNADEGYYDDREYFRDGYRRAARR